jgi:poly-gamma-glutamate capsule biosynthesis protein CapA/YwtB (metallophosphatase superfamily)
MNPVLARILLYLTLLCTPVSLQAEEVVINAVGDIMLAGRWVPVLKNKGYGFPFAALATELAGGDINLANLESPIATCGIEYTTKKFRFRAEPEVAHALRTAGFNLVTLANNHSMDFGGDALTETLQHLAAAGIAWVGAGENLYEARKMALYNVRGKKVAFLAYSLTQPIEFFAGLKRPGTAPGYERLVGADVASARRQADHVIVSFHWGTEASGDVQVYQRKAARAAIDAGADVIIGHHPHVLQGVERYGNGIIFYSLGNFTFASKSRTSDVSAIIRLRFNDKQRTAEILPLDVLHRRVGFQPKLLGGMEGESVIAKLNELSKPFNTGIQIKQGRYSITF